AHVAETDGFNHQRICVPFPHRVAIPPGLRIDGRSATVGEYLPLSIIRFVDDQHEAGGLNDFSRLWMAMKLHRMERQAVRILMVFAVLRQTLLAKLRGPRLERQTSGQH